MGEEGEDGAKFVAHVAEEIGLRSGVVEGDEQEGFQREIKVLLRGFNKRRRLQRGVNRMMGL